MNILLLKAEGASALNPAVTPPLGLMYLTAYLKKENVSINIKIVDTRVTRISPEKLRVLLEEFHPDITGISAVTMEANSMHELAGIVKGTLPQCKVIAGGPHPSSFLKRTLEDRNIDFVVRGEGEVTFKELVDTIEVEGDVGKVKGIAFRNNGDLIQTEPREFIKDLDSIPFPAWEYIDIDVYSRFLSMSPRGHRRYMVLYTSRSCPYQCIYCHNIFGKGFRARSPENVLEEIDILYNKYGINEFEVIDDIFNFDVKRAERICDLVIERRYALNIAFPNGLRSDRLDKNLLEKMRLAGTKFISFAVESASPRIQKVIKKNLNLIKVKEAINYAVDLGIFSNGFFMLGFPTEQEEEIKETIRFAIKSKLHSAYFFVVKPFEGTELFEKFGLNGANPLTDYIDSSYFKINFNISEVENKKLLNLCQLAYFRFYFNPLRIIRMSYCYIINSRKPTNIIYYFWFNIKRAFLRMFIFIFRYDMG